MIQRLRTHCLLTPEDVPASHGSLQVVSTFNPGVTVHDGEVILLVRVAEAVAEHRPGFVGLPRWKTSDSTPELVIDWAPVEEVEFLDVRVVRWGPAKNVRLTFTSHLKAIRMGDGLSLPADALADAVCFWPRGRYETFGVEDPRVTKIGEVSYFTYVAVSRHGAMTALASTRDFRTYERHGVIFPPENKDVLLFPEKIGGEYWAIHRPNPHQHFSPPEMWTARSPDLLHWGRHEQLYSGLDSDSKVEAEADAEPDEAFDMWQIGRIGGSVPPLRLDEGWLEIYHGNGKAPGSPANDIGTYAAAGLLLDGDNPNRVLARTREPLLLPGASFEVDGFVPNVIFPTGAVDRGETLLIYYGAADTAVGVAEVRKADVLGAMS